MLSRSNNMFGIYPDIREKEQNILRLGIGLFQLLYPKRTSWPTPIHGPFALSVTERDDEDRNKYRNPLIPTWHTSGDAKLIFERVDKKTAIAWMPDDPWWHNRLTLMDSPSLLNCVTQLRLPDNSIKTGDVIKAEIKCMEEVLKEEVPVYNVMTPNLTIPVASYLTEVEAKEYIEDVTTGGTKITPDNKVYMLRKKTKKYEIKIDKRYEYKKEVIELILKEKGKYRFGWTESPVFREKYRPQIIKLINDQDKVRERVDSGLNIAQAIEILQALPEEEKNAIKNALIDKEKKTVGRPKKTVEVEA